MQFSTITAIFVTMAATVSAVAIPATPEVAQLVPRRNCVANLNYCGDSLTAIGHYDDTIRQSLTTANIKQDKLHISGTLFKCLPNGQISPPIAFCPEGCFRAPGRNDNDACFT